jgi:signal transduction histidine kinase
MSRSLTLLWAALTAAIALIGALAFFWNAQREQIAQQRVEEILQSQLLPFRRTVSEVLEGYAFSLQRRLNNFEPSDLRECVELARMPLADEVVVIDPARQLHFPRDRRLTTDRQSLVDEALQVLRELSDPRPVSQTSSLPAESTPRSAAARPVGQAAQVNLLPQRPDIQAKSYVASGSNSQSLNAETGALEEAKAPITAEQAIQDNFGWITWYHRRGIVLGFWSTQGSQWRTMIVLPRARWMADVVGRLPESRTVRGAQTATSAPAALAGSLVQVVDVEGKVIYQWGSLPENRWAELQAQPPAATLALDQPLEGWRLQIFAGQELRQRLAGDSLWVPLLMAVVALSLALLLAGMVVTFNVRRELRLAASRVSFVNQVSHELRTPLTNIRMYADLLAQSLEQNAAEAESLERVAVIQGESQRLGRLISNVLQFARPQLRASARRVAVVLDALVEEVIATFRPRLERAGFEIVLDLQTPELVSLDVDCVEQILVNLIGNAEKYAAAGKFLQVSTRATPGLVTVDVWDRGPGIPSHQAEFVFAPFARLRDSLQDPTGTGIGLTIVRRLAHEHGGTCELISAELGAHFRCRLATGR